MLLVSILCESFTNSAVKVFSRPMLHERTLRRKQGALDRQRNHARLRSPDHNLASRHTYLAPNVAKCHRLLRRMQESSTRDLADFLLASDNLHACSDLHCALGHKSRELSMYSSPRANALHNLLTDVAAFVEVQRARLLGFLRQVALANIYSVRRNAGDDALQLQCFRTDRGSSCRSQCIPQRAYALGRNP